METSVITTIISTSGAVIVGPGGMWISANQVGKRIDDLARCMERLEDEVRTFQDVVSGKFASLDLEIAKLIDKRS